MAKIPDHAKRVFEGVIFDVYHWPQELYDGSVETFEALKRPSTVVILAVTSDGKIVTIEDEQPTRPKETGLPAGRIDHGEEPLKAAQRELLEETGYTSDQWEEWWEVAPREKIDFTIHYFIARNAQRTAEQKLDPGERITVAPVEVEAFIDGAVDETVRLYELGTYILRRIAQGKRNELENFLASGKIG